jgi:hypothetical protein
MSTITKTGPRNSRARPNTSNRNRDTTECNEAPRTPYNHRWMHMLHGMSNASESMLAAL